MNVRVKYYVMDVIIKLTKKKFEANLNLSKRKAPNQFVHLLPYYKIKELLKTTEFNRTILN